MLLLLYRLIVQNIWWGHWGGSREVKRDFILCMALVSVLLLRMALIWVTGPSGAGKSAIGASLRDEHQVAHILPLGQDTEIIFKGLS